MPYSASPYFKSCQSYVPFYYVFLHRRVMSLFIMYFYIVELCPFVASISINRNYSAILVTLQIANNVSCRLARMAEQLRLVFLYDTSNGIQSNLSNPTHQGTREICRIVQNVGILMFYLGQQKYFRTTNFCRMSQEYVMMSENLGAGLQKFHCIRRFMSLGYVKKHFSCVQTLFLHHSETIHNNIISQLNLLTKGTIPTQNVNLTIGKICDNHLS